MYCKMNTSRLQKALLFDMKERLLKARLLDIFQHKENLRVCCAPSIHGMSIFSPKKTEKQGLFYLYIYFQHFLHFLEYNLYSANIY